MEKRVGMKKTQTIRRNHSVLFFVQKHFFNELDLARVVRAAEHHARALDAAELRLLEVAHDEDAPVRELAQLVRRDPALLAARRRAAADGDQGQVPVVGVLVRARLHVDVRGRRQARALGAPRGERRRPAPPAGGRGRRSGGPARG